MSNNPHLNPFVVPNLDPPSIDTLKTCTQSQIRKYSSTLKETKINRPLFSGCLSALVLMCRFTSTSSKTLSKCWLLPCNTSNTPIYAWSSHEQSLIAESIVNNDLAHLWNNRIIDAKKRAKRWAKIAYPGHKFETMPFRGRHTLDQYLELIGYKVPTVHGAGKTGARLTVIREMISTGRMFDDWPPSVKSHWTKLLAHNKHDCFGMMAIVDAMNSTT